MTLTVSARKLNDRVHNSLTWLGILECFRAQEERLFAKDEQLRPRGEAKKKELI
jgi:hypothetical protein